jgi:hypothetical protein
MKTYRVPVTWEVCADYYIEANSEEEAIKIAEDLPLPEYGEYLTDSFKIDYDDILEEESLLDEGGDYE